MTSAERKEKEKTDRVLKKFGRKKYMVSKTASLYPLSAEREYRKFLRYFTEPIFEAADVRSDGIEKDYHEDAVKRKSTRISKAEIRKIRTRVINTDVRKELEKIVEIIKRNAILGYNKSFRKTFGAEAAEVGDVFTGDEWIKENMRLLDAFIDDTIRDLNKLSGKDDINVLLEKIRSKTATFVRTMARGQVCGLNGSVTEAIQREAGIGRYVWVTSRDERVRECHRSFDGKIFRWDDPPEIWYKRGNVKVYTGRKCHPGQDYNCRCTAKPVFEKEDIKKQMKK